MSTRVFVGGLTYRVRERDLEKFFRKYGRIKEVAMKNGFAFVYGRDKSLCGGLPYGTRERDLERFFRGYGRFRDVLIKNGYGFVEFDDYRDADDAVYELNGKELLGERITVERARGTPRGSDQWRYGDSRGGYGDSRRSARDDMRHDRDSVNRNTRTASSYKQSLPRYGPPTRTEYRLTVENLSSRVSWQDLKDYMRQAGEVTYADAHKQRRNEGVVEFATYSDLKNAIDKLDDTELNGRRIRLIEDKRRGRRSRSSSSRSQAVAVLVATAVVAPVPSQEHTRSPSPSLNPNPPSVVVHAQNPNQETAQSRNLSQSPNPDLVLGPRLRGQSPGRSPNPKPSLPQRIGRAASVPEVTDPAPDQEANIARAVVALVRL
ncbi:PREDICTED: LOW QUALITY PROTEIN: serine-arginine protein 55-like [Trachymyrmex cornetzi]|uniref:LOW QUALITY PROTEIN: serine-arginine protein 55-like n=1 Tax=Trachymyrmex cornetzi TaxID=471704 RepID=UPI00084F229B|nr:PREDICTED: LOW QUALITY PROTEIN: serine-arginine protein 55-like [Trachymyrmex cornetzi]